MGTCEEQAAGDAKLGVAVRLDSYSLQAPASPPSLPTLDLETCSWELLTGYTEALREIYEAVKRTTRIR